MNIQLPKELNDFLEGIVRDGLYEHPDFAICDALRLLKDQVDLYKVKLEELRALIAVGVEQADRGELIDGDEVFRKLRASE